MDLGPALNLAIADFKKTDFSSIAFRSGAIVTGQEIQIRYLNLNYTIRFSSPSSSSPLCGGGLRWGGGEDGVSLREKIIILHYLTRSKGTPLSGREIDFRELPGGNLYYPVFEARVHRPFLKVFGANPNLLFLNFSPEMKGQVIIPVFPRISIQFFLYPGDEEIPSAGKVIFDANISDYLTTEDVVVVCEDAVKTFKNQDGHSERCKRI